MAELLEPRDGFAPLRNGLRRIARERGNWAGLPMPLQGEKLIIEPGFPNAAELMAMQAEADEALPDGVTLRNTFYSTRRRCDIYVWSESGKVLWGWHARVHGLSFLIKTLGASYAWGIEQESNALQLLGTLVRHHTFKQYLLTGMFMETSKRSGLTYVFRKLRPTVVLDLRDDRLDYEIGDLAAKPADKGGRILSTLCLHPIAFYDQSWAGAMAPTDDVIAHLMLMRGDEPMFWRRSNQHNPAMPEAGLS